MKPELDDAALDRLLALDALAPDPAFARRVLAALPARRRPLPQPALLQLLALSLLALVLWLQGPGLAEQLQGPAADALDASLLGLTLLGLFGWWTLPQRRF